MGYTSHVSFPNGYGRGVFHVVLTNDFDLIRASYKIVGQIEGTFFLFGDDTMREPLAQLIGQWMIYSSCNHSGNMALYPLLSPTGLITDYAILNKKEKEYFFTAPQ